MKYYIVEPNIVSLILFAKWPTERLFNLNKGAIPEGN